MGCPLHDDCTQFKFLLLEGALASLSWQAVVGKRDSYHSLFADFDSGKVARFTKERCAGCWCNLGAMKTPPDFVGSRGVMFQSGGVLLVPR